MKKITLLAAFAFSSMQGCALSPASQDEAKALNYGPKPVHWQETIRDYLSVRLTDPKSALVEFRTEPRQMFQQAVALEPTYWGWAACVWVNDKNREGAYDGFRPMTFFIRNEKIVHANNDPDHRSPVYSQFAKEQCAVLGAPFG